MVEKKVLSKIVLIGEMNVGKTTLMNSFVGSGSDLPTATVGSDTKKKEVKLGNVTVTL